MYVDDGAGGAFVEANSDNDATVRMQPTLRQLVITRISTLGAAYKIKVVVHSQTNQLESPVLGIILAAEPLQPPIPVLTSSSSSQTVIDISNFPSSSNGGCTIVSFDIQRNDGQNGAFTSLVGLSSPY